MAAQHSAAQAAAAEAEAKERKEAVAAAVEAAVAKEAARASRREHELKVIHEDAMAQVAVWVVGGDGRVEA